MNQSKPVTETDQYLPECPACHTRWLPEDEDTTERRCPTCVGEERIAILKAANAYAEHLTYADRAACIKAKSEDARDELRVRYFEKRRELIRSFTVRFEVTA